MSPAFRPVFIVLTVLVLMLAFSSFRKRAAPHDNLPWRKDLNAAKQEAAAANKPLLVYFTATWCGPCQAMARDVWPQPQVAAALQSVVPVKIDVDEHPDVAGSFNVNSIPRLQLVHPDGAPGASREGLITADELAGFLQRR
jgi:thioredoxin-like negative regulator of GroEL